MRSVFKACLSIVSITLLISCSKDDSYHVFQKPDGFSINGGMVSEETLPNGVRIMAVSLPGSDQPKMSVSVGVGSAHDPAAHPGLAHFVEHMLFLGNKEYPDSLETDNFIQSANGYRNAYTSDLYTNYQLTTDTKSFSEAVRRYSRFFVSPLFTDSLVQKEKNAIQNEYVLRFDIFKLMRASAVLEGPHSVNTVFNIGNLESLKDATGADARAFYEKNYSAKNMVVVISGPQSVTELKDLVRKNFSDVPARDVTLPEVPKSEPMQNKIVKMTTTEGRNRLQLDINVVKTENPKVKDALSIIGTIFGDESKGSLLSVLQDQGYALPSAGALSGSLNDSELSIGIQLTDHGVQNYTSVISLVKGYMEFLKTQPEPRYILNEMNGLSKASELTRDYTSLSVDDFSRIADQYNEGKTARSLLTDSDVLSYEPSDYQTALSLLNIVSLEATLITVDPKAPDLYSQKFANIKFKDTQKYQIETVDGVDYIVDGYYKYASILENFDHAIAMSEKSSAFSVPKANPYIPMDFKLKSKSQLETVSNVSTQNIDVFFNPLSEATLPETRTSIYFFSSGVNFADKKELAKIILMKNWLITSMNQDLYPFTIADVDQAFNVMIENKALRISLKSWSDKAPDVVRDYVKLIKFSTDEVAFQKYKNITLISIDQKTRDAQAQIDSVQTSMYLEYPTLEENRDVIESITLAELQDVYKRFFSKFYTQAVVSGHYSPNDGIAIVETMKLHLPSEKMTKEELDAIKKTITTKSIEDVVQMTIDTADSDSSIVVDFYQMGTTSKKENLMSKMIGEWIGPEFYYELRTQQQLAYSLWAGYSSVGKYYGVLMQLESSSATSMEVETAIRNFVIDWTQNKLPQKAQSDVNNFINKETKLNVEKKKILQQEDAVEKFLGLGWEFEETKEADMKITIKEVIEFANQKLLENPAGLMIKVKSNTEKETQKPEQKIGNMH